MTEDLLDLPRHCGRVVGAPFGLGVTVEDIGDGASVTSPPVVPRIEATTPISGDPTAPTVMLASGDPFRYELTAIVAVPMGIA